MNQYFLLSFYNANFSLFFQQSVIFSFEMNHSVHSCFCDLIFKYSHFSFRSHSITGLEDYVKTHDTLIHLHFLFQHWTPTVLKNCNKSTSTYTDTFQSHMKPALSTRWALYRHIICASMKIIFVVHSDNHL